MPEGDILRRTAAELDAALAGKVLLRAELRWPTVAGVDLVGRTVLGTRPYGKHLLTRFDDGRTLHTHLRMDGAWTCGAPPTRRCRCATRRSAPCWSTTAGWPSGDCSACSTSCGRATSTRSSATLGPDLLDDTFDPGDGPGTGIPPSRSGPVGIDAPGGMPGLGPGPGIAAALDRYAARGPTTVAEVLLDQHVVAASARSSWPSPCSSNGSGRGPRPTGCRTRHGCCARRGG